jgi:hypothetical protein
LKASALALNHTVITHAKSAEKFIIDKGIVNTVKREGLATPNGTKRKRHTYESDTQKSEKR